MILLSLLLGSLECLDETLFWSIRGTVVWRNEIVIDAILYQEPGSKRCRDKLCPIVRKSSLSGKPYSVKCWEQGVYVLNGCGGGYIKMTSALSPWMGISYNEENFPLKWTRKFYIYYRIRGVC